MLLTLVGRSIRVWVNGVKFWKMFKNFLFNNILLSIGHVEEFSMHRASELIGSSGFLDFLIFDSNRNLICRVS